MEIDPKDVVDAAESAREEREKSRLNAWVAVVIALLATFLGICKVVDDNIVQAMQQDQATKVDEWGYYQAKNTQQKLFEQSALLFKIQAMTLTGAAKELALQSEKKAESEAARMKSEKEEQKKQAEAADKDYDARNYHDDQFDLSDASLSVAIALLALTSLTQKKWLFWMALIPTAFGIVMGIAGLFALHIHPDALSKLLSP